MAEDDSSPTVGWATCSPGCRKPGPTSRHKPRRWRRRVVEGHAAGGAVVIRLTGSLEAESVHIDPSIIDPSDPALLEDAVLAALHDALGKIVELRSLVQMPADPAFGDGLDLGGPVGNLDLGALLGVDLEGLMGNLGIGMDLLGLAGLDEEDDEDSEDQVDDSVDDDPQA